MQYDIICQYPVYKGVTDSCECVREKYEWGEAVVATVATNTNQNPKVLEFSFRVRVRV